MKEVGGGRDSGADFIPLQNYRYRCHPSFSLPPSLSLPLPLSLLPSSLSLSLPPSVPDGVGKGTVDAVNGVKATEYLSRVESLLHRSPPFSWVLFRPPWVPNNLCCKACICHHMKALCTEREVSEGGREGGGRDVLLSHSLSLVSHQLASWNCSQLVPSAVVVAMQFSPYHTHLEV